MFRCSTEIVVRGVDHDELAGTAEQIRQVLAIVGIVREMKEHVEAEREFEMRSRSGLEGVGRVEQVARSELRELVAHLRDDRRRDVDPDVLCAVQVYLFENLSVATAPIDNGLYVVLSNEFRKVRRLVSAFSAFRPRAG